MMVCKTCQHISCLFLIFAQSTLTRINTTLVQQQAPPSPHPPLSIQKGVQYLTAHHLSLNVTYSPEYGLIKKGAQIHL